ncbi:MAG: FkbM family methyltransferase [Acidobacteriota bacterium]|nr:FkbM family methyltransferase [Acidobacteriota bacterium]
MTPVQGKISSHHIGGRGGTGSHAAPPLFSGDLHHVYYEADASCVEQIVAANRGTEQLTVLPLCIGRENGRATFNIDYDPCMSSLLELNPRYGDYTLFMVDPLKGPLDYRFADTGRAMERREVEVVSLDSLYAAGNPPAPPPDFLSMDTQGSEYEILEGAAQTLERSVLALRLEVAFQPIYKGQKLFGDLCALLTERGFQFMKMLDVYRMFPAREPIGLRAGSVDAFGEALFFRTPEALRRTDDAACRYLRLLKTAFIALCQGQLEYALGCLRDLGPQSEEPAQALAGCAYPAFLRGLAERAESHPRDFPPLFSDCYSFAQSRARFDGAADTSAMDAHIAGIVTNLREDVARRGGRRLCVLPFGHYARQLADLPDEPGLAPPAFFDNGFQKHRDAGLAVQNPAELGADDYVVILSETYGPEIAEQVSRIRGDRPERTLTYKELIEGRRAFDRPGGETPVEQWLREHGFDVLARRVRELRIAQTHQRRAGQDSGER